MTQEALISSDVPHRSIMVEEVLKGFQEVALRVFYDGTLGAGGHGAEILKAHPELELYIGCDRDPQAIEIAKTRLFSWKKKVRFIQDDSANLDQHLSQEGLKQIDGFFLI
jgi:16S rRNA (cytosine1402-N4)-methyltransferase